MELQRKLRELVRFGYDVFISYSRSDGLRYAQTLYVALNERGLAPFIDVVGTSPGQSTPTLVLRRLRRSSMLVLVCSTGAAASKNIGEEIAVFTPTGRNIVVIDIEGALVGAGFKAHLGGLPVHAETASALASGKPSTTIVDSVLSAVDFVRRSSRLRHSTIAASLLAATLLAGSALISTKIIADANRTARRARIGTLLEQDGGEATRLFQAEPLNGLLAAMKGMNALQTLEGKDLSFLTDLPNLPAVSPITALVNSVGTVRERNQLARYPDTYLKVVFSPDGSLVAAHSKAGEDLIGLFDVESGREVATLKAEYRQMMSLSFSPASDVIASGGLNVVSLYSARTGKLLRIFTRDEGFFYDVSFSPDRKFVLAAHHDKVRIWNAQSGVEMEALSAASGSMYRLKFSPDGKTLAAGGATGVIALWQVDSGQLIKRLQGHTSQISSLVFAPNGAKLFSTSLDNKVIIWNLAAGTDDVLAIGGGHNELTVSPDGRFLAQAGDSSEAARVWDLENPEIRKVVNTFAAPVGAVAFDTTGRVLLVAHGDGVIGGYRVASWADGTGRGWKAMFRAQAHDRHFDISAAATGYRFATGGEDGILKLWDAAPIEISHVVPGVDGTLMQETEISSDGRFVARVLDHTNLTVFELASGRRTASLRTQQPISATRFSVDGRMLVIVEGYVEPRQTHLLEAATGKELPEPASGSGSSPPMLDADGRHLARYADGKVEIIELASARQLATWRATEPIELFALSSDAKTLVVKGTKQAKLRAIQLQSGAEVLVDANDGGRVTFRDPHWILSSSDNGSTRLWDTRTGRPVAIGSTAIGALILSPNGGQLAYVDESGIHVWDLLELRERSTFTLADFPIYRMSFDPSGRMLAIERNGGAKTMFWDVSGQREVRTLSDVGAFDFSADGQILVARSFSGDQARLLQVATNREIGTLYSQTELAGIRFTPGGETLLGWTKEGELHIWPTRLSKWREAGCAWVAGYLALHPGKAVQTVTTLDGEPTTQPVCGAGQIPSSKSSAQGSR